MGNHGQAGSAPGFHTVTLQIHAVDPAFQPLSPLGIQRPCQRRSAAAGAGARGPGDGLAVLRPGDALSRSGALSAISSKSVRGGIPVLFPICGGLPGDRLPLPQGEFTLPQHGFARDRPWQLAELDDGRGVAMGLEDSAETRPLFPFAFSLTLEVRLACLGPGDRADCGQSR
jgi:hypothetical protein